MKKTALIALALIGTAVALSFTTDKGAELRRDAARGSKKLRKRIRKQAAAAGENVGDFAQRLLADLSGLAGDIRDRGAELLHAGEEEAQTAKKKARRFF